MAISEQKVTGGARLERLSMRATRTASAPAGADPGRAMREVSNAAQFLSDYAGHEFEQRIEEERMDGQYAFATGVARDELIATGAGAPSIEAYDAFSIKSQIATRTADIINNISEYSDLSPEEFRDMDKEFFRSMTEGMTPMQKEIAIDAWGPHINTVMAVHTPAHASVTRERIIDSARVMLDARLAAGDIEGASSIVNRALKGLPGISKDESRSFVETALLGRMQADDTTLYDSLLAADGSPINALSVDARKRLVVARESADNRRLNKLNVEFNKDYARLLDTIRSTAPGEINYDTVEQNLQALYKQHGVPLTNAAMQAVLSVASAAKNRTIGESARTPEERAIAIEWTSKLNSIVERGGINNTPIAEIRANIDNFVDENKVPADYKARAYAAVDRLVSKRAADAIDAANKASNEQADDAERARIVQLRSGLTSIVEAGDNNNTPPEEIRDSIRRFAESNAVPDVYTEEALAKVDRLVSAREADRVAEAGEATRAAQNEAATAEAVRLQSELTSIVEAGTNNNNTPEEIRAAIDKYANNNKVPPVIVARARAAVDRLVSRRAADAIDAANSAAQAIRDDAERAAVIQWRSSLTSLVEEGDINGTPIGEIRASINAFADEHGVLETYKAEALAKVDRLVAKRATATMDAATSLVVAGGESLIKYLIATGATDDEVVAGAEKYAKDKGLTREAGINLLTTATKAISGRQVEDIESITASRQKEIDIEGAALISAEYADDIQNGVDPDVALSRARKAGEDFGMSGVAISRVVASEFDKQTAQRALAKDNADKAALERTAALAFADNGTEADVQEAVNKKAEEINASPDVLSSVQTGVTNTVTGKIQDAVSNSARAAEQQRRKEQEAVDKNNTAKIKLLIEKGVANGDSFEKIKDDAETLGVSLGMGEVGAIEISTILIEKVRNEVSRATREVRSATARARAKAEKELPWRNAYLEGNAHTLTPAERQRGTELAREDIERMAQEKYPGDDPEAQADRQAFVLENSIALWKKNNVVDTQSAQRFNSIFSRLTSDIISKDPGTGEPVVSSKFLEAARVYSAMYQANPRLAARHVTDPTAQLLADAIVSGGQDLVETVQNFVTGSANLTPDAIEQANVVISSEDWQEELNEGVDEYLSSVSGESFWDFLPGVSHPYDDQNTAASGLFSPGDDDMLASLGPVIRQRIADKAAGIYAKTPFASMENIVRTATKSVLSRSLRIGNTLVFTPPGRPTPMQQAGLEGLPPETLHTTLMDIMPDLMRRPLEEGGFGPAGGVSIVSEAMTGISTESTYLQPLADGVAIHLSKGGLSPIVVSFEELGDAYRRLQREKNISINNAAVE